MKGEFVGVENEIGEVVASTKMIDFEDPLFDEKFKEDKDYILEEIWKINGFLAVEPKKKVEEIVAEVCL